MELQTFMSPDAGAAPIWQRPAPAALELCSGRTEPVWKPVRPVCPAQRLPFPTGCAALLHSEFNSLWAQPAPGAARAPFSRAAQIQIPAGTGNDSQPPQVSLISTTDTELCKVSSQPQILTEGCISKQQSTAEGGFTATNLVLPSWLQLHMDCCCWVCTNTRHSSPTLQIHIWG